jgi:hypothetical protein
MASNLYMISVNWIVTPQTTENIAAIDKILGELGDWLRFSGSCWLIVSEKTSADIFRAMGNFLKKDDCEIIAKIDPSTVNGWAPKWIDDWITARRPLLGA